MSLSVVHRGNGAMALEEHLIVEASDTYETLIRCKELIATGGFA
jgi:hypothetical protein